MKLEITIKQIDGEGYLCIKLADLTLLKRSKAFKPPTIEEVKTYCEARKNGIDATLFIAYYKTRGWFLSKGVKMKDWKSAITTWEKNNSAQPMNQTPKGTNLNAGETRLFIPREESKTAITRAEYLANKNK